jgi:hypothetical protein
VGALTIAFDIIIVGALALPWVILAIHLFYFEGENRVGSFLGWLKKQEQPAAVGILLFAMAYTLGSAVTRVGQDIFNDDDLYLQVDGQLFRWALTEDRILASVYCESKDNHLLRASAGASAIAAKISTFKEQSSTGGCDRNLRFRESHRYNKADDDLIGTARDIFGLQENALMDKGGDYTVRLRQLHDQVMVLRGAAFNGVVGLALCLFAWGAALRREQAASWLRLVAALVPTLYLAAALIAAIHHFWGHTPFDPPLMEFTLGLLGCVGGWLVWRRPSTPTPDDAHAKELESARGAGTKCHWQKEQWAGLVLLSAILTAAAILGWWSTEVLYGQQVIYSYDSQEPIATQK